MKPRLRIVYHMRLGDVIRCLPIARFYFLRGYEVELECATEYHGVQDLVSYVTLVPPYHPRQENTVFLVLQIWPNRAEDFEESGMTWQQ